MDHLRAFAAVLVLLYHSTQLVSQAIDPALGWAPDRWLHSSNPAATLLFEGHTGVALFMVLSGFIFTIGTLGKDIAYGPFLRNRVLRIYPLYLVLLFVGLTAASQQFDLMLFLRALLPLSSFGPVAVGGVWGAMFWAVAVELQFYLLFPFLLHLLNRHGPGALVRLVLAMVALRGLAWALAPETLDVNGMTYYSIVGRIDQFLLGMLAGWVFVRRARPRSAPLLLVGGSLAVLALLWVFNQLSGYSRPTWWRMVWVDAEGAAWAVVIVALTWVVGSHAGRVSRAVAAVGERSYSIYLLHFVLVSLVATHDALWVRIGGPVTSALATGLVVVLPLTVLLSWLTYAAIERPFLRMRGTYVRDARPAVAADPAPGPRSEPASDAAPVEPRAGVPGR
ncbi:acyltransferase family protein [Actinotalea solisilvae]|uniref:acyltransferase family protein n=1 Tax=Actinotalea solisilvae TaxID=2072922 RepID=UPI0018F1AAA6|nr:acyltransferase [Actinotalea solisilvae]